ncbi:cytochrome P450 [Phaeosphaeriaceae sp. SRC1lsM3a]|nr:cytochrome P450 [Stagonospora sp. SRC1lsM3a]
MFADTKGNKLLSTIKEVQETDGGIELRATRNDSVHIPPGPRLLPFVGNRYKIYSDVLGNYNRLFTRYGPMIKTVNMGTTIYVNNDPIISRHILREDHLFTKTTSDPLHPLYMSEHNSLFTCDSSASAFVPSHKFVPPMLSPRAVASYIPVIQDAIDVSFPVFGELAPSDSAINVYQYMFNLASSIIWRAFEAFLSLGKKKFPQPKWFKYVPVGDNAKHKIARTQLFAGCEEAMHASIDKDGPFLSLSDPKAIQNAKCMSDYLYRATDKSGERLPWDLVLGNLAVTVGAGFATASALLSWPIYALCRYPAHIRYSRIAAR